MAPGGSLKLEGDYALPVQVHFDTLTQKATLGFVLIAVLTLGIMTTIDEILNAILAHLNPCGTSDCLTIYEPASWSVVRWLSAVFLAILCVLPFALRSMYRFAEPGLTQDEQSMLKRWMLSSATFGYITLFALFYVFIPKLYDVGDSIHSDVGLTAQYDAVSLFVLVLSIFWGLLITYILAFATITSGALGLITENNQDRWRIRLLGIGGLVVFLSLPGRWNGVNIILLSLMIVYLEFSIRKSIRVSNEIYNPSAIFDHEGRRRYVTYVDCSCQGVAYPIDTSPEHTGLLRYQALCDNLDERRHLISMMSKHQLTDVIIGGCDASPLPESFQETVSSARCTLRGLDLLGLQGSLPNDNIQLRKEVNIHLGNVLDPWSSKQRLDACMSQIGPEEKTSLTFVDSKQWPELKQGILRISGKNWSDDERNTIQT
ncbi:MAG: twin-arginine translocase subunit TatC [Candidatus Thermoplasmatota archaeon]|nr:twin-arginine translocase subunit TatC [Candidatus Thermoplasmatota archaeon]